VYVGTGLRERQQQSVNWIPLDQDREQRRALVNKGMEFRVPEKGEKSLDYQSVYQLLKKDSAPYSLVS
jgi:hypothetical protein